MITRIGLIAGDIWNYLESHARREKLDTLIVNLGKQEVRDIVLMSLGWLAREGHVVLEGDLPNYTVILKERDYIHS
ncbi:MAG: winged helix-turn-helix domain-containing protein [Candidatus Omnitrophica bacterium]|nr:winged helix-turn-helix domain-containing protein [Candidatus Omnitrophota bacterium]